jgi:crossover junction endodeoxyribonuclease RuvC
LVAYQPECLVMESLFFNKNTRTAVAIGQAQGVVLLAAAETGIPVVEYTPLQVKQAVVGYGRASKRQIQQLVQVLLHLPELPRPDDVADALALTICHLHAYRLGQLAAEHAQK